MREDRPIRRAALNASESRTDAIALTRAGVASIAMPDVHLYTADATTSHDWIAAGITIAVALVIAHIVDRTIARRGAGMRRSDARTRVGWAAPPLSIEKPRRKRRPRGDTYRPIRRDSQCQ